MSPPLASDEGGSAVRQPLDHHAYVPPPPRIVSMLHHHPHPHPGSIAPQEAAHFDVGSQHAALARALIAAGPHTFASPGASTNDASPATTDPPGPIASDGKATVAAAAATADPPPLAHVSPPHLIARRLFLSAIQGTPVASLDDICAFLGSRDNAGAEVLAHYVREFDPGRRTLLGALRTLAAHLYLNAEAQAIDRVLAAFARRFVETQLLPSAGTKSGSSSSSSSTATATATAAPALAAAAPTAAPPDPHRRRSAFVLPTSSPESDGEHNDDDPVPWSPADGPPPPMPALPGTPTGKEHSDAAQAPAEPAPLTSWMSPRVIAATLQRPFSASLGRSRSEKQASSIFRSASPAISDKSIPGGGGGATAAAAANGSEHARAASVGPESRLWWDLNGATAVPVDQAASIAHTVLYSLLMLNTDLHSHVQGPSTSRMTKRTFVANTINALAASATLSPPTVAVLEDVLKSYFSELKRNPLRQPLYVQRAVAMAIAAAKSPVPVHEAISTPSILEEEPAELATEPSSHPATTADVAAANTASFPSLTAEPAPGDLTLEHRAPYPTVPVRVRTGSGASSIFTPWRMGGTGSFSGSNNSGRGQLQSGRPAAVVLPKHPSNGPSSPSPVGMSYSPSISSLFSSFRSPGLRSPSISSISSWVQPWRSNERSTFGTSRGSIGSTNSTSQASGSGSIMSGRGHAMALDPSAMAFGPVSNLAVIRQTVAHRKHLLSANGRPSNRSWRSVILQLTLPTLFVVPLPSTTSSSHPIPQLDIQDAPPPQQGPVIMATGTLAIPNVHSVAAQFTGLPTLQYTTKREHVWSLTLADGSVYLVEAGSATDLAEWVHAINASNARASRGVAAPTADGVGSARYGWEADTPDLIARSSSARLLAPWYPPPPNPYPSTEPDEAMQLGHCNAMLRRYETLVAATIDAATTVDAVCAALEKDATATGPTPAARARARDLVRANWRARLEYLNREVGKWRIYTDALAQGVIPGERPLVSRSATPIPTDHDLAAAVGSANG
ncbi:Sec7 domain-containing protein, partial [Blastocladiella britannica]